MDTDIPIQAITQVAAPNITSLRKLYQQIGFECDATQCRPKRS